MSLGAQKSHQEEREKMVAAQMVAIERAQMRWQERRYTRCTEPHSKFWEQPFSFRDQKCTVKPPIKEEDIPPNKGQAESTLVCTRTIENHL